METFVLSLYGFWFWLTRKYRTTRYREVAVSLNSARDYLLEDFGTRASTRDRGFILPHQLEAIDILERHFGLVSATSRRFASLNECCKFVTEELIQNPTEQDRPAPIPVPARAAVAPAIAVAAPAGSVTSFASFWGSESGGVIDGSLRLSPARLTLRRAFAGRPRSFAQEPSEQETHYFLPPAA